MRYLALDYGDRRIGVAISDPLGWFATGICVLERKNPTDHKACIAAIEKIISEHDISVIILGFPLNMDGTQGENCEKVKTFAKLLQKSLQNITIEFFDERMSTQSAIKIFHAQGKNERKLGAGSTDKKAAEIILQNYLDGKRNEAQKKENEQMAEFNEDSIFDEMDDLEMESLVVTDDEGNELEYIIIDEFTHAEVTYLVLMKADEVDDEEVEAVIFKQIPTDDEEEFAFEEISEEEYDELEVMLKARLEEFGIDLE